MYTLHCVIESCKNWQHYSLSIIFLSIRESKIIVKICETLFRQIFAWTRTFGLGTWTWVCQYNLIPPDKMDKVLYKVLLPGAGGPAVVILAPDEVDDWGEAGAAEDVEVHGQVEVPGPHPHPQHVPQHIQAPGQQVIGDRDNIPLSPATIEILSVSCHGCQNK